MSSADLSGVLLCCDDERQVAQACADQTGLSLAVVQRHRFPDGEVRVRLPESLPARVVLWRGLHQPNDKLVELMLVARTARTLGAQHLTLVAPYLAYMRQDIAFNPGEAVSQRIVALEAIGDRQGMVRELAALAEVSEAVIRGLVQTGALEAVTVSADQPYPAPDPGFAPPALSTPFFTSMSK